MVRAIEIILQVVMLSYCNNTCKIFMDHKNSTEPQRMIYVEACKTYMEHRSLKYFT